MGIALQRVQAPLEAIRQKIIRHVQKMSPNNLENAMRLLSASDGDPMMNRNLIAQELVGMARDLVGKGAVPEAFKKQWKKNKGNGKDDDDKGDDKGDKKDDKLPDFLKKKKSSDVAQALLVMARKLVDGE